MTKRPQTMIRKHTPFRIFDPDHPGQPRIHQPRQTDGTRQSQPSSPKTSTRQSADPVLGFKIEALLDLHQQHLDAIHAATILISNLLKNAPDVHG